LPAETSIVGPFVFGASTHEIDFSSDAQFDNRSHMIEFCLEQGFVKNAFFDQDDEQLVTYRWVGTRHWERPFEFHKYAQMDFILINIPWKKSMKKH